MAAAKPTINAHIPKVEIITKHKVIRFGTTRKAPTEDEAKLFSYLHQRADLKVSRGNIPVGFYSCMFLDEGQPLFLETRFGGYEEAMPVGPQFQISWKADKEVIPPLDSMSDGWYKDLDDLWTAVLSYFEKRAILSEETLEYFDADPFVLFGIDDPLTQQDYLCLKCYAELHSKGSRKDHAPFCLVPCALCVQLPAKIHCTFTDKSLCHKCYALSHIKMLPLDGKENQPRRINYVEQYNRYAEFAKARVKKIAVQPEDIPALDDAAYESVLSTDWHPFYDARGVKYYHNFATGERMRQSPRRVPNMEDKGEEKDTTMDVTKIVETTNELLDNEYAGSKPLEVTLPSKPSKGSKNTGAMAPGAMPLTGFDSLKSDVPAAVRAAEEPETRLLRPPHRTHMPKELPAEE